MDHHHTHHHPADAYERVLEHLRSKHIRITETRKAIISYIIDTHEHPSAEKIYKDLLPKYPNMSLATVYNNMKVLVDEGFVTELKITNDNTTYYDFLGHQHVNIVCESCGKITDFEDVNVFEIEHEAHRQTKFKITQIQLMAYGVCPSCQLKQSQLRRQQQQQKKA